MKKDVVIVGNGIAGMTLAMLLLRKEIPFVLLYRQDEKPSFGLGETLPPSAIQLLKKVELFSIFEVEYFVKQF